MRSAIAPFVPPLLLLAACEPGPLPVEDPFDGTGDLEQGLAIDCTGFEVCHSGAVYTALYRIGATPTSKAEILAFFDVATAAAPQTLRVPLRTLRAYTGTAQVTAKILSFPDSPTTTPVDLTSATTVATASLPAGGLHGAVTFDFTGGNPGTLAPGGYYALLLETDEVAEGTVVVGVGALSDAGDAYGTGALRRARRSAGGGFGAGRFRQAGPWDVSFGLHLAPIYGGYDVGKTLVLQYAKSGHGGFYNFISTKTPAPVTDAACRDVAGGVTKFRILTGSGFYDESVDTSQGLDGYHANGSGNCRVYTHNASLVTQANPSEHIVLGAGAGAALLCAANEFPGASSCEPCSGVDAHALTCNALEASSCPTVAYTLHAGACVACTTFDAHATTCTWGSSPQVTGCEDGYALVNGACQFISATPDDDVNLSLQYVQGGASGFYNYLTHALVASPEDCRDAHSPGAVLHTFSGASSWTETIDTSRGTDGFGFNGAGNCRVYVTFGNLTTTSGSHIRFDTN